MKLLSALTGTGTDRPDAVTVGAENLSWEALRACAGAVAARIAGAPAIAVHATPTLHTVVAVVGGLLAGVPVVPLPVDAGPVERAHLLRDSGAVALLGEPKVLALMGDDAGAGQPVQLMHVDMDARLDGYVDEEEPDRTALILYTSGTTGAPKGVPISRRAIAADLDGLAEAWQWTPDDTLVHGLPLFHVHGLVLGLLGPLRIGCAVRHTVRPTAESYAAAGGSLYFGVPTVWSRVCAEPSAARALRGARLLVSGSAALPGPVFADLESLTGHRAVERYGMTETLITISARADGPRLPGRVGHALPGIDTRIVDERGVPVPDDDGTIGALQVRGPTVFGGYRHGSDPVCDGAGWFDTGDAATRDATGNHRIVGRAASDLIKTGGFRVGAGEVEDVLLSHPGVSEAAVVGEPDADLGQVIVGYVVASGVTDRELIGYVAGRLSVHKRPRRIRFVDSLPRNALGKVQKNRL